MRPGSPPVDEGTYRLIFFPFLTINNLTVKLLSLPFFRKSGIEPGNCFHLYYVVNLLSEFRCIALPFHSFFTFDGVYLFICVLVIFLNYDDIDKLWDCCVLAVLLDTVLVPILEIQFQYCLTIALVHQRMMRSFVSIVSRYFVYELTLLILRVIFPCVFRLPTGTCAYLECRLWRASSSGAPEIYIRTAIRFFILP